MPGTRSQSTVKHTNVKRVKFVDGLKEGVTYIIAERDQVLARVISEESQGLVQTSVLVGAGVLGRDQVLVRQLQLIESTFFTHL